MSVDLSDSKAKLLTQKEAMTTMNTVAVGGVPGLRVTVKTNKKGEISRFYTLRLTINGKRTQRGVGSVMALSINQARMKALDLLESSKAGLETRTLTRKINLSTHIPLTVEELFRSWQEAQVQRKRWKDPVKTTRDDLARFLKLIPENLRQSSPEKLSPQDIADAILPHWENIHESCLRTCARLSEAYDWGLRNCRITGKNPAQFKNGVLGVSSDMQVDPPNDIN